MCFLIAALFYCSKLHLLEAIASLAMMPCVLGTRLTAATVYADALKVYFYQHIRRRIYISLVDYHNVNFRIIPIVLSSSVNRLADPTAPHARVSDGNKRSECSISALHFPPALYFNCNIYSIFYSTSSKLPECMTERRHKRRWIS